MVAPDKTHVKRPDYLAHIHLYPIVAGVLEYVLGFVCMCICVLGLYQMTWHLPNLVAGFICFGWMAFGVPTSVFTVVSSVCSVQRKCFRLALFGSYMAIVWYSGFAVLPVIYYVLSSWRVSFSPFDVLLAVFIMSSLSSSALIKTAKSEFMRNKALLK
jgi:hypothetical protein